METLITLCVCAAWLSTCPCLPGTPSKAKSTGGAQRGRKGRKEGGEGRGKVCLLGKSLSNPRPVLGVSDFTFDSKADTFSPINEQIMTERPFCTRHGVISACLPICLSVLGPGPLSVCL